MATVPGPEYVRLADASSVWPFSDATIRRYVKAGVFPAYRVGGCVVLVRSEVDAVIAEKPVAS